MRGHFAAFAPGRTRPTFAPFVVRPPSQMLRPFALFMSSSLSRFTLPYDQKSEVSRDFGFHLLAVFVLEGKAGGLHHKDQPLNRDATPGDHKGRPYDRALNECTMGQAGHTAV